MIPVSPQPEPADFDRKVRQPGLKSLRKKIWFDDSLPQDATYPNEVCSHPAGKWYNTWTKCLDDLHTAYNSTCAYLGIKIEHGHVEHFLPKNRYRGLAYEWTNYRLAQESINIKKSSAEGIFDPFTMPSAAFFLDILHDTFCLSPNPKLSATEQELAKATIEKLNLNQSFHCRSRRNRWQNFIKHKIPLELMKEESPFLWSEIIRQNLEDATLT